MPSILPPVSFPPPLHSLSVPSPLSPLRYSPNLFICYPVSSCIQLVHSSPRQLVNLPVTPRTCSSVTLSLLAYNLFPRPPVNSSTYNVTHRTCSSVTLSLLAYNLFPRPPINSSTCSLLLKLVHLLPCLLIQLTCSLIHSLIRLLVNYFYHLTFLSVLV